MSKLKLSILFLSLSAMFMVSCSKEDELAISELEVTPNEEDGLLKLTWDQGDCESVDIYRSEGMGEPVFYETPTLHHVFNDKDVESGKTYNYKVVSTDPEGIESSLVNVVCPEFGIRLGDIKIRQEGRDILIDWKVRFAKSDDNWKINISNNYGELIESIENSNVNNGTVILKYAAEADKTLRYTVYLDLDEENVDSEDVSITIDHTYNLAATNVRVGVKSSASQSINVKWDAAADAEGYTVTSWINNSIVENNESFTVTDVDVTFSGITLATGDIIEVLVTGYKTVGTKQYSSNSETVELIW